MNLADAIRSRERVLELGDQPDAEPTDEELRAAAYEAECARLKAIPWGSQ